MSQEDANEEYITGSAIFHIRYESCDCCAVMSDPGYFLSILETLSINFCWTNSVLLHSAHLIPPLNYWSILPYKLYLPKYLLPSTVGISEILYLYFCVMNYISYTLGRKGYFDTKAIQNIRC